MFTDKNPDISYEFVQVGQLADFEKQIHKNKTRFPFLPLTDLRAKSQIENPCADKNDAGLIVVYCKGVCVGYLGLLPSIFNNGGVRSKVFAFTSFYVDANYRKQKIAYVIMELAFSLKYDYYYTGYTDAFYKFSVKNPQWFKYIGQTNYIQINRDLLLPLFVELERLRHDKNSIFSKNIINKLIRGILFLLRRSTHLLLINSLANIQLNTKAFENELITRKKVKQVANLGKSVKLFDHKQYFERSTEVVNWMIRTPWISTDPNYKLDYFFSVWRKKFEFLAYEFYTAEKVYLGYAVYRCSLRGEISTLTILDHRLKDKKWLYFILDPDYLLEICNSQSRLKGLTLLKTRGNFLAPTKDSAFPENAHNIKLQLIDADKAFT
jgi:hypothetical protein